MHHLSDRRRARVLVLFTLATLIAGCADDGGPTAPEQTPSLRWVEESVPSWDYLNNRFFRIDLPPISLGVPGEVLGYSHADAPGRNTPAGQRIVRESVRVYRSMGGIQPGPTDIQYVAAAIDSSGIWDPAYVAALTADQSNWEHGWIWRPVSFSYVETVPGDLVAIDLGQEMSDNAILAVTYDVADASGNVIYEVGDQPEDGDAGGLSIGGQPYYRMKLLKPENRDYFTFQYVLRNIYDLSTAYPAVGRLSVSLETTAPVDHPDRHDDTGYTYLNVFGLDVETNQGLAGADGLADLHRSTLFDLTRDLLWFPLDVPFPFAAYEELYRDNALEAYPRDDDHVWQWDHTLLSSTLTPELYDWRTSPSNDDLFGTFRFVLRYQTPIEPSLAADLTPIDQRWYPSSLPVAAAHLDHAGRAEDMRWFAPVDPVRVRWLNPTLTGSAGEEVVPSLELVVNPHGEPWQWAGLMTGFAGHPRDFADVSELVLWVNDFRPDPATRAGVLHVDLGMLSEDFAWPVDPASGEAAYGTFQTEDLNQDGVFNIATEDVGLDAWVVDRTVIAPGRPHDPAYGSADDPFPALNATAGNRTEDTEDLDRNTRFDRPEERVTWLVDLAADAAVLDAPRDHPGTDLAGTAWRQYVLPLAEADGGWLGFDDLARVSHLRIWFEAADGEVTRLQVAGLRFR